MLSPITLAMSADGRYVSFDTNEVMSSADEEDRTDVYVRGPLR